MVSGATYQPLFDEHRVCVLIPTFNNAATLEQVVGGVLKYTRNIIVVNDGSTDTTSNVLERFGQIITESYPENKGKGYALRTGFAIALKNGYHYAITIDSDGQHYPDDLPKFIDALREHGPALIIGSRNMNQASVPGKSSFGNRFSNFWFWVETGLKVPDTQSGYRLYPVKLLEGTRYFTNKFEFEVEVIVRAAWKGIAIGSVPVSVYYAPRDERVSHFRPFTDFTRISILNTVLVIITLFYINPRNFLRKIFRKDTYLNLRKEMFNKSEPKGVTAASISLGIFMGIVPIWGFQMLVAIALAVLLRLNKALVLLSANISIPPMIPFIIFLSYKTGALWLGDNAVPFDLNDEITLQSIHLNFIQYLYGSITLAFVAALAIGSVSYLVLLLVKKSPQHNEA